MDLAFSRILPSPSTLGSASVSVGSHHIHYLCHIHDLFSPCSRPHRQWEGTYPRMVADLWKLIFAQSSLTLSLLRCILTEGKVYYDGIPTDSINLDALRSNITIIPQIVRYAFAHPTKSILTSALHYPRSRNCSAGLSGKISIRSGNTTTRHSTTHCAPQDSPPSRNAQPGRERRQARA